MKALILSCGGSPKPLKFCIQDFEPDFAYFLCSNDSVDIAHSIAKDCNLNDNQFNVKVVDNHESLEDSFAKSREIIQELQREYDDIHVDFTGGTKPMVSGLVLAAIGEECTYSYVGSKDFEGRDKEGLGVVRDGFESIMNQRDPYDVFAVVEFQRGMDFFNNYQFAAAKANFIEASRKLESEDLRHLSKVFISLVNLYDMWDKFNNADENKNTLNKLLTDIFNTIKSSSNVYDYLTNNCPEFLPQIENNIEFLKLKISKKGVIKSKNVPYYLSDLLNNTYRRIEERKYDDAVARLYRSIELIAQMSLCEFDVINQSNLNSHKEFTINTYDLESKFNGILPDEINEMHEYGSGNKSMRIGLKNSYIILSALGSQYAKDYLKDEQIKSNLSFRNRSVLAHGLQPIDEKLARELYSQVLTYAKRAFPDVVKYMNMADFPKFE